MLSFVVHRHFFGFIVNLGTWWHKAAFCQVCIWGLQSFLRKRNLIIFKVCSLGFNDVDSYSEENMACGLQIRHPAEDFRIK